jgi:hypothetical protein
MATADTTTHTADPSAISGILGDFCAQVIPHLRKDIPAIQQDDMIEEAFNRHTRNISLSGVSAAEAYVAINAIEAAQRCGLLGEVEHAIGHHLADRLANVMAGDDLGLHHSKADTIARLDWVIEEVKEHASGYVREECLRALKRARWSCNVLIARGAAVDHRARDRGRGPTFGEVEAVEKAFANVGLSAEAAHQAIGLVTPSTAAGQMTT